jgi:tetraacyldisaccharide 4'-kinase
MRGLHRVEPGDTAANVGDEALLLAAVAPTWVGADRAASARAAIGAGAQVLVMDDGLQNPTLHKDLSLLVVDGASGFGNKRVLPAGPLREPLHAGAGRCQAAVVIGPNINLPSSLPVLHAHLAPAPQIHDYVDTEVLAFAGIAVPDKFFTMLRENKVHLVKSVHFPDHHPYRDADICKLIEIANGATLVTTPKDAVRLPTAMRSKVRVVGVSLAWDTPAMLDAMLDGLF